MLVLENSDEIEGISREDLPVLRYEYFVSNMPQQTNSSDCGVFSLMFLKFFAGICSGCAHGNIQKEMRYCIANELMQG